MVTDHGKGSLLVPGRLESRQMNFSTGFFSGKLKVYHFAGIVQRVLTDCG